MKRYSLEETGVPYEMSDRVLIEDPNGEWVRYEDVKGILEYKDQLRGYKTSHDTVRNNKEDIRTCCNIDCRHYQSRPIDKCFTCISCNPAWKPKSIIGRILGGC